MCLYYTYGVRKIWGVKNGYQGFYNREVPWVRLTPGPEVHDGVASLAVTDIHNSGGTVLGSARGGFDDKKGHGDLILDSLAAGGRPETGGSAVNMLFTIGGDGTHRGAGKLALLAAKRGMQLAVAGVPKSIDNDIPLVDKTFGFDTAVEEAVRPIQCANTEAMGAPNGVGLVQLMGRDAGFIALHAAMASRVANLVLLPEAEWRMDALLDWLEQRLEKKGHAVVVVAEGAGNGITFPPDLKQLAKDVREGVKDASGNAPKMEIGMILKSAISKHFGSPENPLNGTGGVSLKYIDPSYIIRSSPPCASDSNLCTNLAYDAVHGAFAGFTGLCVGS